MTSIKTPSRFLATALLAAILVLSFSAATLHAEDKKEAPVDFKKGKWGALTQYIGTYDYKSVLNDKAVKAELDAITKGHDINLDENMAVSAPIGFENDCLLLKGNKKSAATINKAFMEVCIGAGSINLAVYDNNKINIFTRSTDYQYMSEGMRAWIYFNNHDMAVELTKKPENVQLVVTAP